MRIASNYFKMNEQEQIHIYELIKKVVNKFAQKLNLRNDKEDIIQDLYLMMYNQPVEKITEQYIYRILYYQVVNKYNEINKLYFKTRKNLPLMEDFYNEHDND